MSQAHLGCNPNMMTKLVGHPASSWRREHSRCVDTTAATIWACHDPSGRDATDATIWSCLDPSKRSTIDSTDHTDAGPDNGDRLSVYLLVCSVDQDRLGVCRVVLGAAAPLVLTSVLEVTAVLWLESFVCDHSHGTVASC